MEFIRTESQTDKPFAIDYCLIVGEGSHPRALDRLSDEDALDVLAKNHMAEAMALISRTDPGHPLLGTGDTFYVGYDAEWTAITDSVLGVESYQFYASGIGGDLAVIFYPNSPTIEDRLTLAEMLAEVLRLARETG